MEREEGEMSDDDNAMLVDDYEELKKEDVKSVKHTTIFKAEKNGIVVTQLEKIDAAKIEERARRFGLNLFGNRVITQQQIDELYTNFGIESGNERHFRLDTLHLNGVDGLTTRDIFEYLEDYKPLSLERIDAVSCNIVCQDHISAALALLVHSREIKSEELKEMLAAKSCHHWREGMPHPKKDLILMRFATNGEKKLVKKKPEVKYTDEFYDQNIDSISKNPWGDLCKSWGVYDHQEILQRKLPQNNDDGDEDEDIETQQDSEIVLKNRRLAMRLGKRTHKIEDTEGSSSDSEWKKKSKVPRMRMHADDEESKLKKKQLDNKRDTSRERDMYAPLSIQVLNSKNNYVPREGTKLSDKFKTSVRKTNVQSRLGAKIVPGKEAWSCDESSTDGSDSSEDHNVMSRVQKVNSKANSTNSSNVWSRLESKDQPESHARLQSDLRNMLKSKKHNNKRDDLRDRISKSKQSNLRIEIDNNYVDNL